MSDLPTKEQLLSDPDGIQLRATNTPASVGGDCVFTYKNATTNYAWEAPASSGTGMPIGCMIMYYTNTGFTTDPAGAGNGYFLNFFLKKEVLLFWLKTILVYSHLDLEIFHHKYQQM